MSEQEKKDLASYVAEYLNEEADRGNTVIDKWLVLEAINSFLGGAGDE
jgi:hypothetical protein